MPRDPSPMQTLVQPVATHVARDFIAQTGTRATNVVQAVTILQLVQQHAPRVLRANTHSIGRVIKLPIAMPVAQAQFRLPAQLLVPTAKQTRTNQARRNATPVRPIHGLRQRAQHLRIVNVSMDLLVRIQARAHSVRQESGRTRGGSGRTQMGFIIARIVRRRSILQQCKPSPVGHARTVPLTQTHLKAARR